MISVCQAHISRYDIENIEQSGDSMKKVDVMILINIIYLVCSNTMCVSTYQVEFVL